MTAPTAKDVALAAREMLSLTRRLNLQRLVFSGRYKTQAEFARAIGKADPLVTRMLQGKSNMGEDMARHIERTLDLDPGWLDKDQNGRELAAVPDLPDPTRKSEYGAIIAKRVAGLDEGVQLAVLNLVESFLAALKESGRDSTDPRFRK